MLKYGLLYLLTLGPKVIIFESYNKMSSYSLCRSLFTYMGQEIGLNANKFDFELEI